MSNVTNYLSPEEINAYQSRIDNADAGYNRSLAKLGSRRQEATSDFNTSRGRLNTQWDNYQRSLGGQFAKRNILRSGLMGRALDEYASNRQNSVSDLERSYDRQVGGFNETQKDMDMLLGMNRIQVDKDRTARQQTLEAQRVLANDLTRYQ